MSNSNSREGEYPARVTACRSKDLNQSIKTAVISTSIALNNLMINYWLYPSLLLFHTFSLSVCLSGPLSSPTSFPLTKIRHRLQHESCRPVFGSVTGDFAAGATAPPFNRIFSLSLSLVSSCPLHPQFTVAMAPARSPQGPPYLHSSSGSTGVSIRSNPTSCQRKPGVRPLAVKHSRS